MLPDAPLRRPVQPLRGRAAGLLTALCAAQCGPSDAPDVGASAPAPSASASPASEDRVAGRLLSPEGHPLAGKTIVAKPDPGLDLKEARTESTKDGTFVFAGLRPGWTYTLQALGYHLASPEVRVRPGIAGSDAIRLTGYKGVEWSLRFVDSSGRPPTAGHVMVTDVEYPEHSSFRALRPSAHLSKHHVAPEGEFGHLAFGPTRVRAVVPGCLTIDEVIDAAPGSRGRKDFVLDRGLAVSGVLVDESGAPAGGVALSFTRPGEHKLAEEGATDAEGRFELNGLRSGSVELFADGTPATTTRRVWSRIGTVTAPAVGLRLALPRPSRVKARLAFDGPAPQVVEVRVAMWVSVLSDSPPVLEKGPDGTVPVVDGLLSVDVPPGRGELVIGAPGYCRARFERTFREHEDTDLGDVRLSPPAERRIRVVDPFGSTQVGRVGAWPGLEEIGAPDELGVRVLKGDPSRKCQLTVEGNETTPIQTVTVSLAETSDLTVKLSPGVRLRATVRDREGRSLLPKARVSAHPLPDDHRVKVGLSDMKADACEGLLLPGTYRVEAKLSSWPLPTVSTWRDVELVLGRDAEVDLQFTEF